MGWKTYDERFKLRRSVDPNIPWSKVDYELWLMFMTWPSLQPAGSHTNPPHYKCYNFNFKGSCDRPGCHYLHKCIRCSGVHPRYLCLAMLRSHQVALRVLHKGRPNLGLPPPPCKYSPTRIFHKSMGLGNSHINITKLKDFLECYPDGESCKLHKNGFSNGFRLHYTGPRIHVGFF